MHTSVIKNTIELDKKARNRVLELKEEKANIDERIKSDQKELLKQMKLEVEQAVLEARSKYEAQLYTRQSTESLQFKQVLDEMTRTYEENRETWINEIVAFCEK
ncbi:MAG: hypothetical protein WCZ13_02870 [Acholeplasmataceae bacterium]